MILVDYSQVSLAAILSFQRELKGNEDEVRNLIRHVTITTIKSYKQKYGHEYGEIVICCDGRNYWRKEAFEYYKASRKKTRDKSDLNWKLIFDMLSEMRDDFEAHFPWRVISLDRAEADDIIAVIVKYLQDNELVQQGIVEEPQKTLIISSDRDFIQLQQYENVRQWSPMVKKYLNASYTEIKDYMIKHITKGDAGDGIPNILSHDSVFVDEIRQKPMSAKRLAEFYENGIDACRTDEEIRNWHRNQALVDFKYIPEDIQNDILNVYKESKVVGDKMSVMKYLIENKCRLLLDDINDF